MEVFTGFCIGVYVTGIVICLGLKVMGSEQSLISILFWPISLILRRIRVGVWNGSE